MTETFLHCNLQAERLFNATLSRFDLSLLTLRLHTLDASQETDYYAILSVARTASSSEIKQAYHRALLLHHPDKRPTSRNGMPNIDVDLLKKAYSILSSSELRAKFDATRAVCSGGPRPAQVVSLEEFTEIEDSGEEITWVHDCRCGGRYIIRENDMERGQHLVGCNSCSEVVWVGFEVAEDESMGQ